MLVVVVKHSQPFNKLICMYTPIDIFSDMVAEIWHHNADNPSILQNSVAFTQKEPTLLPRK